jgi:hypothetical protein
VLALAFLADPEAGHSAEEPTAKASRSTDGLIALYTFDGDDPGRVEDRSGFGEPLDLRIDKPQAILRRGGTFRITAPALIASDGPAKKLIDAIRASSEVTIEAWIEPQDTNQSGPARIVTLSENPSLRNLTLGQDNTRFELRLRSAASDDNGIPATTAPEASAKVGLTHLVFTHAKDGTRRILIDGKLVTETRIEGTLDRWDGDHRLAIGNELTGDRPWHGKLHLVAIYDRALSDTEARTHHAAGIPATDLSRFESLLPPPHPDPVDFLSDIQPILKEHCYECHSGENEDGGVNLGIRRRALQGGDQGPILVPGNSLQSRLVHLVAAIDKSDVMPPDSEGLSDIKIAKLRAWIDRGADWPPSADVADPRESLAREHWAFQPLREIIPPATRNTDWPLTPIDRFVLAKLEGAGLQPQGRANPRQLIRRIQFDLIGLPPTPEELDAFSAAFDRSPDAALDALVDRLLQSPHHGERWARHWLDVARYADSDGQESDRDRPTAYHYRDFVIRALCDDMPYDQFIRWQLAGDEYEPQNPDAIAATGFLAAGPFAALPDRLMEDERLRNRYNELDDIMSTIGSGLLGLTLGCVRCHDHKYDAIPARDYYSILAAFHGGERAEIPLGQTADKTLGFRDRSPQPSPTWLFQRGDYYDRDQPVSLGFVSVLTRGKSPEDYLREARDGSDANATSLQRRALAHWMTDVDHGAGALLARVIVNRVWQHHFGQPLVQTVGDFGVRSEPPSHPELLEWLAHDFVSNDWKLKRLHRLIVRSAAYNQRSAGAPPAADPDNRLLWKMPLRRLEGEILRDTMLACGGDLNTKMFGPAVKPQIASEAVLARNLKDPYPNRIEDNDELRRRSVYLFHKRVVPYPWLQAFDKPDAQQSCSRRDRTTVAPQALALLNDPFSRQASLTFAGRLIGECIPGPSSIPDPQNPSPDRVDAKLDTDLDAIVRRAYLLALARPASDAETAAGSRFISGQLRERMGRETNADAANRSRTLLTAVADFAQVVFSLNEFIYVD